MKFCNKCNNMYYIRLSNNDKEKTEESNNLVYYCRNCGNNESNIIDTICVSKTQIKKAP